MPVEIVQVDAFTSVPFRGNPAAVCLLDEPAGQEWMQLVACEMNLSETAFAVRDGERFGLRWFTPAAEVDLCGHATLATAHVLYTDGHLATADPVRFDTASGEVTARWVSAGRIELDFPAISAEVVDPPPGLLEALGIEHPVAVARSTFDYLVEVAEPDVVRSLLPDLRAVARVDARGVMVTAPGDGGYDIVTRFFGPAVGVDEDPVTGSAHCVLGPWWRDRVGRDELHAFQASARGGELWVRVEGERVILAGHAVTVLRGHLEPPTDG